MPKCEAEVAVAGRGLRAARRPRVAASMRAFGLLVRAGAPRRSQASSRAGQVAARSSAVGGLLLALAPAGEVGGVAEPGATRRVHVGAAPVELEHLGRHAVEHVAVVGDEHEPAG